MCPNTARIEALSLASKIKDLDALRLVFAALVAMLDEKPNRKPIDYVRAIEQVAARNGFIPRA